MPALDGITNSVVLAELFKGMGPEERAILCSVKGNPSEAAPMSWSPVPWKGGECPLHHDRNNYVAISSFREDEEGRFKRRKAQFSRTWCIMIDDVNTKIKYDALPKDLPSTLVIETSPGNFQFTYFLDQPHTNADHVGDAIREIIKKLTDGGVDPGMAGVTRVLRLPQGINGKPRADGPWQCKVWRWRPEVRVSWQEVREAFGIIERFRMPYVEPNDGVTQARIQSFKIMRDALKFLGLFKGDTGGGWFDITCPWIEHHTARANTGSAVAPPMKANGYMGGFKCHHGHCEAKNWGDLESWVADTIIEEGERRRGPFYGDNE